MNKSQKKPADFHNPIFSTALRKPTSRAGSDLLRQIKDKMVNVKHVHYRPAKVHEGKGQWFIFYSYRNPETGKFVRFKEYADLGRIRDVKERRKHAEIIAKAVNELLEEGYNPFEVEDKLTAVKNWTVFQSLHFWISRVEQTSERSKTVGTYTSIRNKFNKEFDKVHEPIRKIVQADIEQFLFRLKKREGWTNTTYNNYLRFIKTFFNFCVDSGYIDKSPIARMKKLPAVVSKHRYFDPETFRKVKMAAGEKLLPFIEFLYETGLRPQEARYMKFEHIRGDKLFVPGTISKNKKDEYVPLSRSYVEKLKGEPAHYIFGGSKITGANHFGNLFRNLKEKTGLDEDFTLYSVKHTRAVDLAKQGADPYEIMNLLRHSSLEITMKYLRDLGLQINRNVVDKYKGFE